MSDLNIRNNLHTGIEFEAQGSNLVATVTPETVGAAPTVHDHSISDVLGLQTALDSKQDVGGNFDDRYLRVDDSQFLSGLEQSRGRGNLGLGTAALLDAPVAGDAASNQVVLGNDTRLAGGGGGGSGAVEVALGNMSGTVSVDLDDEKVVHAFGTLTGNTTLSFSNIPAGGITLVTLAVTQDGTGGRTLTFPAGSVLLNGGDGSINPTASSTTWVTMARTDGTWYVSVADSRANDYDDFYWSPPDNGTYIIGFRKARSLDFSGVTNVGGATVAFHKSTNNGSSWGSALSGVTSFASGDLLRLTVSDFDSFCAVTVSRVG